MKKLSVFLSILLLIGLVCFGVACQGGAEAPRDGVFLHISHGADDPHRLLMALNMASIMAEDKDVLVYFDIKGVEAVLRDAEEITFAHFPSSKASLKSLMDKNAVLMACPGCLKAAGKSKDDLAEGIRVADKKAFFSFTKGRIVTLDY
ncbi:DsrE family protein [Desulfoluna spongiiphila]|uniref:Predicted peroxiredoxin n=1 Tax=Desulfoluna spongiiphila TaxID=419481 RepID=A0A1G5HZ22_9BACT|nr:DsrE family protein [Desulfoluna spongiiphila]SCY68318.1 Predicted peroxiredoxin [Desulfoluna spongiiphila]VVS94992.1 prokaryotic membrane lipoprotein lipid attachment site profile [Desulfoluna spongiiphila]